MSDKMIERIQGLLRKAEASGVSEQEAESLRNKAFELAAKYEIDNALVHAKDRRVAEKIEARTGTVQRPFNQLMMLADQVYKFCGCRLIKNGSTKDSYWVYGYGADLDRASILFASLLVQGTRQVNLDYRYKSEQGERRSTYKRAWWQYFMNAIASRLAEIKRNAEAESDRERTDSGPSTELVLRDRKDAIDEYVAQTVSGLRRGRRSSRDLSGSGAYDGREAGRRADLGSGKLSAQRKELS